LSTTTEAAAPAKRRKLKPVHPGEILREEFLSPLSLTPYALAKAAHVPRTRIERLVREETPVTADTALRLERVLGVDAAFWTNLQSAYDLRMAELESGEEYRALKRLVRAP
jgi:addiction module HigA family antidote